MVEGRSVHEFEALIRSLGENIRDYLDSAGVGMTRVTVEVDAFTQTAHVVVELRVRTWEAESKAIDVLLDVRGMFVDDISFDYEFTERASDSRGNSPRSVGSPDVVYA